VQISKTCSHRYEEISEIILPALWGSRAQSAAGPGLAGCSWCWVVDWWTDGGPDFFQVYPPLTCPADCSNTFVTSSITETSADWRLLLIRYARIGIRLQNTKYPVSVSVLYCIPLLYKLTERNFILHTNSFAYMVYL